MTSSDSVKLSVYVVSGASEYQHFHNRGNSLDKEHDCRGGGSILTAYIMQSLSFSLFQSSTPTRTSEVEDSLMQINCRNPVEIKITK